MIKIKRALISVSDKSGIVELAKELNKYGVEILSTGGSAKALRDNAIPVIEVSDYTGFPEMLDGRVKTLHPKIHGGLLALRDNPEHMEKLKEYNIGLIDMVVVNLYPFEKAIQKPGVKIEEAIENIDIGGPSMLRSASKNSQSVAVICNPERYPQIIEELKRNNGSLPKSLLRSLAIEVFALTSHYDEVINSFLKGYFSPADKNNAFAQNLSLNFTKIQDLRYGENPHQRAAFYKENGQCKGLVNIKQLQGKELSFNNILDLNAAIAILQEFDKPSAVIIKHNNPCGAAEGDSLNKAYVNALKCDPISAFGGIVGLNRKLDLATAKLILNSGFMECIIAPSFDKQAKELFKDKKNLRLLELECLNEAIPEIEFKRVSAGLLAQDKDIGKIDVNALKTVTRKKPSKKELESLLFAWKIVKHVKSNAIVLAKNTQTVGIGPGQTSRVESVIIAKRKAGKLSKNSVMASDAFFPKADSIAQAAKAGIKAIIQPGGSISDEEVIKACDKHGISMVFTGMRHFKH